MKSSSPKDLAAFIALLIASMSAGTLYLFDLVHPVKFWLATGIAALAFFLVTYFIVYYALTRFIFEKIQPIYKTIHEYTLTHKELKKQLDTDIISHVNKEVEDWAEKKTREIKKLKQLEKYRKDFLGNVMHELKTPVFNIQGYILTLLDGGLEDSSINRLYLERTEKSINRMISVVEDLESIARLESGELKLVMEEFDIVKLVEEVFEMLEIRAKKRYIKLQFASNYNKSIKVIADRRKIHDVMNNLLINSINYGKKPGKTTVSFMNMGEVLLVDVSDNGMGIPEKDIPRIFERFYRTDKSRSRDQGGTGLGLSIVKHIIEAHNQTINVRSVIDKGSSFVFTLRMKEDA